MIKIEEEDFGILAVCALRYCMGRQTYMPDLVRSIVRPNIKNLTDKDIGVMIDDCKFQAEMSLWGDENIDKPGWLRWREELIAEKEKRVESSI